MISKEYTNIGSKSSAIREMFDLALEKGARLSARKMFTIFVSEIPMFRRRNV